MKKIRLFCIPYAGGSAAAYSKWVPFMSPEIELVPIELTGRGRRSNEPLYRDMNEAITDVFGMIQKESAGLPYAVFGHSMGSMIAYGVAQKTKAQGLLQPVHLFFSGCGAPHLEREDEKIYHLMSEVEFRQEVIGLGGTPPELFEFPDLLDLFLPLLKNDFRIVESEPVKKEIQPLNCPVTVFLGKGDDLLPQQCDGWKAHTRRLCSIHYLEGGHFFIQQEAEQVINILNAVLLPTTRRSRPPILFHER